MEKVILKKNKSGRPRQSVVRTRTTGIRFSASEHFVVQEKAEKAGLKLTTYIRQVAIYSEVKTRLTQEERMAVRQLIGLSNNINQVAKACHEEGILRAMQYFEQYRNQLDLILKKLNP